MKKTAFLLLLLASTTVLSAQKVMTRTGHISFFSSTPKRTTSKRPVFLTKLPATWSLWC